MRRKNEAPEKELKYTPIELDPLTVLTAILKKHGPFELTLTELAGDSQTMWRMRKGHRHTGKEPVPDEVFVYSAMKW